MNVYVMCRSYLYQVEADNPDQATELFDQYLDNGHLFSNDPMTGVHYLEIVTTLENEAGELL